MNSLPCINFLLITNMIIIISAYLNIYIIFYSSISLEIIKFTFIIKCCFFIYRNTLKFRNVKHKIQKMSKMKKMIYVSRIFALSQEKFKSSIDASKIIKNKIEEQNDLLAFPFIPFQFFSKKILHQGTFCFKKE